MLIQLIQHTRLAVNPAEVSAMFIYPVNHASTLEVRMRIVTMATTFMSYTSG